MISTWKLCCNKVSDWQLIIKCFPFFLFKRFKGINQPQSTPLTSRFLFPFREDALKRAEDYVNALVSLLLSVKEENVSKNAQDVLEATDWWDMCYWAPCWTRTELFVQTIQPLFGSFSLSLWAREEHINIFKMQFLAAFVSVRKHI